MIQITWQDSVVLTGFGILKSLVRHVVFSSLFVDIYFFMSS